MPNEDLKQGFLRLRGEFLELCRTRLDTVRAQMEILGSNAELDVKQEALDTLRREVHTIAGSAGTYGYKDVSGVAREFEMLCQEITNVGAEGIPEATLERLLSAEKDLRQEADDMFANPDKGTLPF